MLFLEYVRAWIAKHLDRDESGQTAVEYVMTVLMVSAFLVIAATALNGVLNSAVTKISTWISSQPIP